MNRPSRAPRFLLPAALVLALGALAACNQKEPVPEEETARLIQPVARVETGEAAPAVAGPVDGGKVYETACAACHGTGAAGAPKAGDKGAWGARIAAGKDLLNKHAIEGKGAMPARGGNPSLTDEQVIAAVDHLIALAK